MFKDLQRVKEAQESQTAHLVDEVRLQEQLSVLKIDIEKKFESKLKMISQTNFEKRIDKVANSILNAVDQKFHKDAELKQKIFYKLDERLNDVESMLSKKYNELTNLMNSKVMSTKTELDESIQELRRTCKVMVEQIDTDNISKSF